MKKHFLAALALLSLVGCKAPVYGPSSLQFFDADQTDATQGPVIVGRAQDEKDITEYVLNWGTGSECETIGTEISKLPKGEGLLRFDIPAGTAIPEGAHTLLAFSKNATGTNKSCAQTYLYAAAPATVILGKLEWLRCSLGQTFTGGRCINSYTAYGYSEIPTAVAQANNASVAGKSDWRAPTIAELASIRVCTVNAFGDPTSPSLTTTTLPSGEVVFEKCDGPYQFRNPKIDEILFPDTFAMSYNSANQYWMVNFENGGITYGSSIRTPLRLVRDVK